MKWIWNIGDVVESAQQAKASYEIEEATWDWRKVPADSRKGKQQLIKQSSQIRRNKPQKVWNTWHLENKCPHILHILKAVCKHLKNTWWYLVRWSAWSNFKLQSFSHVEWPLCNKDRWKCTLKLNIGRSKELVIYDLEETELGNILVLTKEQNSLSFTIKWHTQSGLERSQYFTDC